MPAISADPYVRSIGESHPFQKLAVREDGADSPGFAAITGLFLLFKPVVIDYYIENSPLLLDYYYFVIPLAFFTLLISLPLSLTLALAYGSLAHVILGRRLWQWR